MSNTNLRTQSSSVLQNHTVSSCSTSKVQEKTQLSRIKCMHSLKEIKSLFKFLSETLQDYGTMPIFKRTFSQDLDLLENHLTKEIISRTNCTTALTNLRTKFENTFNSEFEERMRKYTRYNAQSFNDAMICIMDSIRKYMLEIILHQQQTQHLNTYLFEYTGIEVKTLRDTLLQHLAMEHESEVQDEQQQSWNMIKCMMSSNRPFMMKSQWLRSLPISKSSRVTITAVPKADHSKSSSSFSDSKQFVCSTCHKCVFNANHDACITKLLKEVNSRAKIQSHKTRNSNKPVDQKSHTQKPGRQIFTGHRFSPNKTSAVYEKTSPRSDLRWKPTGRIFKSVGLRWIPTGKLFDSCTSKVDSEPPHGSNVDIPNIHECKQTLDVSAGTSINVQKEQSLDLSAGTLCNVNKENLRVWLLKKLISQKPLSTDQASNLNVK
ncbi:hypothetical protein Tco_1163952 [Tanacetum coccineum]